MKPTGTLDEIDRRVIRRLCGDIDGGMRPFRGLALEVGLSEADLLARLRAYADGGILRRFGAVLRHRQAGFAARILGTKTKRTRFASDPRMSAAKQRARGYAAESP